MPDLVNRIELFGAFRMTWDGQPVAALNTVRLQALLAWLILHSETPRTREELAFLLWPESNESQSRTNLRQLLHHLRRALPQGCQLLVAGSQALEWRRDSAVCRVDVLEFEAALDRASQARKTGDIAAETVALEQAVCLCQDDLLPACYDGWLQARREQYRKALVGALVRLATLREASGEYAAAIPVAARAVALDPLSEPHHQLLIRLHAANGDRASALRAWHQCVRTMRRELGVEPGPATRELFDRLMKGGGVPAPSVQAAPGGTAVARRQLVGREAEWQQMLACRDEASRSDGAMLVVISGEPGIGKSRLAEELFHWCRQAGQAVARTRCYAGPGQLAYAPVTEWLRSEALTAARGQLGSTQLAELARVVPEVLDDDRFSVPQPLTQDWQRLHFYASVNTVLARAARPLLLVIDDLQWCDADSFEWMHSMFRSPAMAGVLVVGTVRPEETGRDHAFTRLMSELRQSGQAVEIALRPLTREATWELAANTAGNGAAMVATDLQELYRATRGHPLFVIESVRAAGLELPGEGRSRIHAVITARLANLRAASFELAGVAAAVGRSFSFDLLAKATDWDEESLTNALEELWQRRIIESHGASAEYDFTHDRLREVAYDELSVVRRRFVHRRIARAIQETAVGDPESRASQLAAHYEAAGMAEEALVRYREAAEVARRRLADKDAASLLRRALTLCLAFPDTQHRRLQELELLVALGPVLVTTQGYAVDEVGALYERALLLSRELPGRPHLLVALSGAWVYHVVRGHLAQSLRIGVEFSEHAAPMAESGLEMAGLFLQGTSLFHLGQRQLSRLRSEQSLSLWRGETHPVIAMFASPDLGVFCRCYVAHSCWLTGDATLAEEEIGRAVNSAREMGYPFTQAIALNYATILCALREDSAGALRWGREALEVCVRNEFAYYGGMAAALTGWAMAREGDPLGGLAQLREGMDQMRATGAEIRLPFYYCLLAEACARAGRIGEALASVSSGFAFQAKNGEVWAEPLLHRVQGDLLLAEGNREQALACYQKALAVARESGSPSFEGQAAERIRARNAGAMAGGTLSERLP